MLVRLLGQFLSFKGFRAVLVLRYIKAATVYTLLDAIKLRTASLSLRVHYSYIVSIVRFILIESAKVAKLVVSKVVTEL